MKHWLVVLGLLVAGVACAKQYRDAESDYRTFTAGDRQIDAKVYAVDMARGTVTLELENKQRKKVKIAVFSEKDQTHIREHALIQEFQSPRLKFELEKVKVNERRESPGTGIRRDVSELRYDIKVINGTGVELKGIVIAYNIFLEQEHLGDGKNDTQRYYVAGTIELDPLAPRSNKTFKTETYEIYNQKLAGGYDGYRSGAPTHQSGKSKGVWIKVLIKTPSGLTATRDVCLPKNTSDIFGWHKPEKEEDEKE